MAEMEDDVVDDVVNTEETTEETVTYEQAMEWKQRLEKAEKKIVDQKRLQKEVKETPKGNDEVYTKQDATVDRFIAKNPELEGKEDEIKSYLAKGIELDDVKILVQNKDKQAKNLKKLDSMSVSSSEVTPKSTYSKDELGKMTDSEFSRVMDLRDQGKVTIR